MKVTLKEIAEWHTKKADYFQMRFKIAFGKTGRLTCHKREQWHRAAVATPKRLDSAPEK